MIPSPKLQQAMAKLNEFYDKEIIIQGEIKQKLLELEQVKEDIDMLQTFIMYNANKQARAKDYVEAEKRWEALQNGRQ